MQATGKGQPHTLQAHIYRDEREQARLKTELNVLLLEITRAFEAKHFTFYYCKGLRKIVLSNTVRTIGNNAFYERTALSAIVIPDSVTALGTYCFYRCRALSRAVLPDSLTVIPESCFAYCDSLDTVRN